MRGYDATDTSCAHATFRKANVDFNIRQTLSRTFFVLERVRDAQYRSALKNCGARRHRLL